MPARRVALVVLAAVLTVSACTAPGTRAPAAGGHHPAPPAGGGYPAGDPSSAGGGGVTTFKVRCPPAHAAPDDPIVKPDQPGAAHLHRFIGNVTTDARSTTSSLLAGTTTCDTPSDRSAYWVPALLVDGTEVVPRGVQVYYRGGSHRDRTAIRALPNGLRMVIGDPAATAPQPTGVVSWSCGTEGPEHPAPLDCSTGDPLWAQVRFPDCWDGTNLDAPDHHSHLAYTTDGFCPPSHPVAVPLVELNVSYGNVDGTRTTLSSGSVLGYHGDVFVAWRPGVLDAIVHECLHAGGVLCPVAGR